MARIKPLYRFGRMLVRLFLRPFYGFKLEGGERIPAEGAVILTANHRSLMDPILLSMATKRPIQYMAKSELFAFKPFAWVLRHIYAFPVDRENMDIQSVKHALQVLREGGVLGVFPEGKRVQDAEMGGFKNGVAMLSYSSGAPIVPIYMAGERRFRGRLTARVGELIYLPKPRARRANSEETSSATDMVREAMEALRLPGGR